MGARSENDYSFKPGYQEGGGSSANVTIYTHGDDPILKQDGGTKLEFIGQTEDDYDPALLQVTTTKTLGDPAGTFQIMAKRGVQDLNELVADDDWVDIVFTKWEDEYHVMRGLVDTVHPDTMTTADGVTSAVWNISGRDFGKIFAQTQVWFNRYIGENVAGGATLSAFAANSSIFGSPDKTVETFLRTMLSALNTKGNATWELPGTMPGEEDYFNDVWDFKKDGFDNTPKRLAVNAHMLDAHGATLWELAQRWSDPQFCELYCDLVRYSGRYPEPGWPLPIVNSRMAVIFRDRPFPLLQGSHDDNLVENKSRWFDSDFPTAKISRQEIKEQRTARGGLERKNAFFVASKAASEFANTWVDVQAPLWDKKDIERHGLRRIDVQSDYADKTNDIVGFSEMLRRRLRDFFCLNPYFYSGTIDLGHDRPDIRVGMKLVIPEDDNHKQETYYVEGVSNTWRAPRYARTSLSVTRGWRGTDQEHLQALRKMAGRYIAADRRVPQEEFIIT